MIVFQRWECSVHGFYQYKEKYIVNCEECFKSLKKELEEEKNLQR